MVVVFAAASEIVFVVAAVAVALRWHMMVEDLQVNILEFADEMMKVVH